MKNLKLFSLFSLGAVLLLSACKSGEPSNITGWEYNRQNNGGFQKVPYYEQVTGPNLVLIEGGTFTMGRTEQDVMFDWNNIPRRVTVSSFYMDQFEISNFNWLEYLYWIKRTYKSYPMIYKNALPDTNVWRSPLGFNEKFVEYYLRHPAYRDYPVVGVTWLQANDFCNWRTDRVNELILIREGVLRENPYQDDDPFTTESYMVGQFPNEKSKGVPMLDFDPDNKGPKRRGRGRFGERLVRMEDGILLPRYRLPTEAEWEFAYYGLIGNMTNPEVVSDRRTYPWNGHWVRQDDAAFSGDIRANFMRGRGDYMGVAGHLNDNADVTAPVDSYWPNDYGLYNMAGNVSEWVLDVYRPLSSEDFDDFRPFRGNVFKTKVLNNAGMIDTKNTQVEFDVHGLKQYVNEFERVRFQRISAERHDPDDPNIPAYMSTQNSSNHRVRNAENEVIRSYSPDQFYISSGRKKDEVELDILKRVNGWLDSAIRLKNLKYDIEASFIVQEEILANIFDEELREGPEQEYAHEIISMLRDGFADYVINTPGRLKWRNEVEEENIGRLNYRRSDYIDYKDGDIESSVFFDNKDRKNDINEFKRDPDLVMYQSRYEEFDLEGNQIAPFTDRTSWPTTLISNKSRVYKGGAWNDRAYWVSGGTRRFLDEDKAMSSLGFRCAMDRVGSPTGLGNPRQANNKLTSSGKKKKK